METIDVFSARELRSKTGALLRDAEEGKLAMVTKYGQPAFITVPFGKRLIELGINRTLALNLFENKQISLKQAAAIASMSLESFMDLLAVTNIAAVDYPVEELANEAGL